MTEPAGPVAGWESPHPSAKPAPRLSLFLVAEKIHWLIDLSRDQHLAIWKRIVRLYEQSGRVLPALLRRLCEGSFVDELLEDEVFWSLAGQAANRHMYADAPDHVTAVYATAALMAARVDRLELEPADATLLPAEGEAGDSSVPGSEAGIKL